MIEESRECDIGNMGIVSSSSRPSVLAAYRGCILVVVGGNDFGGFGRLQNANAAIVQPQDEATNSVVPKKQMRGRVELDRQWFLTNILWSLHRGCCILVCATRLTRSSRREAAPQCRRICRHSGCNRRARSLTAWSRGQGLP